MGAINTYFMELIGSWLVMMGANAIYISGRNHDDLALIKVAKVQVTAFVSPICFNDIEITPGTKCFVAGWGETHNGSSKCIHYSLIWKPI